MTDAELLEKLFQYWKTRGTPAATAHWDRINEEFKQRIRNRSERAASGKEAA